MLWIVSDALYSSVTSSESIYKKILELKTVPSLKALLICNFLWTKVFYIKRLQLWRNFKRKCEWNSAISLEKISTTKSQWISWSSRITKQVFFWSFDNIFRMFHNFLQCVTIHLVTVYFLMVYHYKYFLNMSFWKIWNNYGERF